MAAEPAEVQATPEGQAAEGQQAPEQQAPDTTEQQLKELTNTVGQMEPLLGEMYQALQGPQQQEQEQPQVPQQIQYDPYTGQPLAPQGPQLFDEYGQPNVDAFNSLVEQKAKEVAQAEFGPAAQQLSQIREAMENQALDSLLDTYPELREEDAAKAATDAALDTAWEVASGLTNDQQQAQQMAVRMAMNPAFFENVYRAGKAVDESGEGVPAGEQVHVEGASGAQQAPTPENAWEAIKAAR